jgi:hypothetical protein
MQRFCDIPFTRRFERVGGIRIRSALSLSTLSGPLRPHPLLTYVQLTAEPIGRARLNALLSDGARALLEGTASKFGGSRFE